MLTRFNLVLAAFAFMLITACAGSKGGGGSSRGGGGGDDDDYDEYGEPAPRADQLKEAKADAINLTEENHKMAKEIFDLKNKLGMPTDE